MVKFLIAAIALTSVSSAAFAEERTINRDGFTFVYSSNTVGSTTVLTGKALPDGTPYTLNVNGRNVTGFVGETPVSFKIKKPLASATEIAQR